MTGFGNVGPALRLARELRKLSQAALARKAGVGKSQLSKYESGRELPKLESLQKVLSALALTPLTFFYIVDLIDRSALAMERRTPPEPFLAAFPGGILSGESQTALDGVLKAIVALLQANLVDQVRLRSAE